ncbi:ATP-binding protein [Streptomyces sp. NPDC050617]|uniref:ATP-binding protein n=1 Tax=Streptomyces sp. NPDC050617 TaxID=3154628 RepID=UPI00343843C4
MMITTPPPPSPSPASPAPSAPHVPAASHQDFPGELRCVSAARRFITRHLRDSRYEPLIDDVVLLVSELAGNAVVHTRSGEPHGTFSVRLRPTCSALRISVLDQGGYKVPHVRHGCGERGRGLGLVDAIADRWGTDGDGSGRTVWFEVSEPPARPAPAKTNAFPT